MQLAEVWLLIGARGGTPTKWHGTNGDSLQRRRYSSLSLEYVAHTRPHLQSKQPFGRHSDFLRQIWGALNVYTRVITRFARS